MWEELFRMMKKLSYRELVHIIMRLLINFITPFL